MRRIPVNPDLHKDDQQFLEKYAELSAQYLENPSWHANVDDVKNGVLNIKEGEYITNHTGHISDILKQNLKNRTIERTRLVKQYDIGLYAALSKLPSYDAQVVFRMECYVNKIEDYKEYFGERIGEIMQVPYYLSTSKEEWKDTKVVYVISTLPIASKARDITRVTNFELEKEVLFLKGANFLIVGTKEIDGFLFIELIETLEKEDFIYNYVEIGFDESLINEDEEKGLLD